MNSSGPFFLLLALCGMASGVTRQYLVLDENRNWSDAQNYCRRYHKDLATITTEWENKRMFQLSEKENFQGWIGLKRSTFSSDVWQWSDGETPQFLEPSLQTHSSYGNCVQFDGSGWSSDDCSLQLPFVCYRSLILVKQNKTWEDALQYCRTHYSGLVLLNPWLIDMEATQAQTGSVWVGLQFLNGKWLLVGRKNFISLDSLPSCPSKDYRCGARNIKLEAWENRHCNEKLNFLCYSMWVMFVKAM